MAVASEEFEFYSRDLSRVGDAPDGAFDGAAGGAACGDLVRISLVLEGSRIGRVTFETEGCSAMRAAGAAVTEMVEGAEVLAAARVSPEDVSEELGGLTPQGWHAADLATDALHRALSMAASSGAVLADVPAEGERVAVAVSGGVDSAVAGLLERSRGADVVAVTVKLWQDPANDGTRSCCSPEAVLTARRVAHSLGLPHFTLDLRERFRREVVERFIDGYRQGTTPNPCVICNGDVRIGEMVALAGRLGAGSLATGHYARVVDDGDGPLLAAADDPAKDQSYMLAGLMPETLARLRFPLASLRKTEVRAIAAEHGVSVAKRPDSQDLCFLAGEGKRGFLERHGGVSDREGEILATDGRALGTHSGHHAFTVGQRRGHGVAAPEPLYVIATDAEANTVTLGNRDELETSSVAIAGVTLHRPAERVAGARLRYHSRVIPCRVESATDADADDEMLLELDEPVSGAAPGQSACLLDADGLIVGRATITR